MAGYGQEFRSRAALPGSEFVPTEQETAAGWQSHGKIAYSPKIQHADELPRDGWDE